MKNKIRKYNVVDIVISQHENKKIDELIDKMSETLSINEFENIKNLIIIELDNIKHTKAEM